VKGILTGWLKVAMKRNSTRQHILASERLLLFVVLLCLSCLFALGQDYGRQFSITPVGGYTFNELMRSNYGNKLRINVDGSSHYGFILDYRFVNICSLEFTYLKQQTHAHIQDTVSQKDVKPEFTWYLLGVSNYFDLSGRRLKGFWGLSIGVNNTKEKEENYSHNAPAFGGDAGVIYYFTKSMGIRLQAEGLMAFNHLEQLSGDSGLGIAQLGVTGGIVFSFGQIRIEK
jgi:outer membrane protein with beta-barrel domain